MLLRTEEASVQTSRRRLLDITSHAERFVAASTIDEGLLTVFIRHTSASLTIQENADPAVLRDLDAFFSRLVPDGDALYTHTSEGPDDMPSHVRSALTQTSLQIPVTSGRMVLGTWQGVYIFEHRTHSHNRRIVFHIQGLRN